MITSYNTAANAITLRGADFNIDTSANPAKIIAAGAIAPSSAFSAGQSD